MSTDLTSCPKGMQTSETLFFLGDALSNSAFRASTTVGREEMRCLLRGEEQPASPIVMRYASGRILKDFVWADVYPMISIRVAELLTEAKVSGWSSYPVEIYSADGSLVPGYQGLSIVGRCQSIYIGRDCSELFYEANPRGRFPRYRGLYFSSDSWDQSDLFMSSDKLTDWRLVTQRLVDLFKKHKVSNIRFEPISRLETVASDQPKYLSKEHSLM